MAMFEQHPTTLLELRLRAAGGQLYAILDACNAPEVPPKVIELSNAEAVSLYQGRAEENLWAIAPYLVRVDEALLDWIRGTLWDQPWGIFLVADGPLTEIRRHFRHFLLVESAGGDVWYFRFYDPRVLTAFLPTCDNNQLQEFLGPVRSFILPCKGELVRWAPLVPRAPQLGNIRIRARKK